MIAQKQQAVVSTMAAPKRMMAAGYRSEEMTVATMTHDQVDVAVVGAGVGGICAAVAAAREGARVVLLEASEAIGGTGVHAYPGLITR
ncbi:MAG: FAD-dependent oxidoreductase, partial [Planctomycetota bacterium]